MDTMQQLVQFISDEADADVATELKIQGARHAYGQVLKKIEELTSDAGATAAGQRAPDQQSQAVAQPGDPGACGGEVLDAAATTAADSVTVGDQDAD